MTGSNSSEDIGVYLFFTTPVLWSTHLPMQWVSALHDAARYAAHPPLMQTESCGITEIIFTLWNFDRILYGRVLPFYTVRRKNGDQSSLSSAHLLADFLPAILWSCSLWLWWPHTPLFLKVHFSFPCSCHYIDRITTVVSLYSLQWEKNGTKNLIFSYSYLKMNTFVCIKQNKTLFCRMKC